MQLLFENFLFSMLDNRYKATKFLSTLSEAETITISDKVVETLYKTAIEKYDYIDFGDIPNSKGDITKYTNFETIQETLDLLYALKAKSGILNFYELDVLKKTFQYLQDYKKEFSIGYLQNKSVIIMMYCTLVTSLMAGLNLLICVMIDYIKTPGGEFEAVLKARGQSHSMEYLLIESLHKFNEFAEKGELKKFFTNTLQKENLVGVGLLAVAAIGGAIIIVPVIRELIYHVYNIRMSVSEYLNLQATFLELNANALKFNPDMKSKTDKKSVVKNQETTAKKLRALADKFMLKFEVAEANTKKEISKKVTVDSAQKSMTELDSGSITGLSLV